MDPASRPVRWLLLAVWAAALLAALALVARYGSNVPSWDGWDMVPTLCGEQPVTLEWLWSQHNEHRVPLPRLILLGLGALALDLRLPMLLNVLALGALSLALMAAAGRLRGRLSATDAFFPLVLLSVGQAVNLLWAWQVQFFSSALLAGVALLLLAECGGRLRPTAVAAGVGCCTLLLPLCGANGVALVPALAVWVGWIAVRCGSTRRRSSLALGVLAGAAFLLTGGYFVGYESVPYHPRSPGLPASLRTSAQFLTIGLGPATRAAWPLAGVATLAVTCAAAAFAGRAAWARPTERPRALGLLALLGACTSLALGLGLGRDGFEPRYVTLAVPAWCAIYLAITRYAPPRWDRLLRGALVLAALAAAAPNAQAGLSYARHLRQRLGGFEADLLSGVPSHLLVERYADVLHPHPDLPTRYLPMLRRAGAWPYVRLQHTPPLREVRLPLTPVDLHEVSWDGHVARATGSYPYLVFELPTPTRIVGLRLRYRHHNAAGTAPFVSVFWRGPGDAGFSDERYWKYSPTGDRATWERGAWGAATARYADVGFWVTDTVSALRIHPDFAPCTFELVELVVLVRASAAWRCAPGTATSRRTWPGSAPWGWTGSPPARRRGGPGGALGGRGQ